MKLTLAEVEHIARLARLGLSAEEKEAFQEQLSAILQHFERLQELDTEDIPPTASVLATHSVMRSDEPAPSMRREDILANAPCTEEGHFRVWTVLEE